VSRSHSTSGRQGRDGRDGRGWVRGAIARGHQVASSPQRQGARTWFKPTNAKPAEQPQACQRVSVPVFFLIYSPANQAVSVYRAGAALRLASFRRRFCPVRNERLAAVRLRIIHPSDQSLRLRSHHRQTSRYATASKAHLPRRTRPRCHRIRSNRFGRSRLRSIPSSRTP
jgi:hypothetical protein